MARRTKPPVNAGGTPLPKSHTKGGARGPQQGGLLAGVGARGEAELLSDSSSKSSNSSGSDIKESSSDRIKRLVEETKTQTLEATYTTPLTECRRLPSDLVLRTPLLDRDLAVFLNHVENGATPSVAAARVYCTWVQMKSYINSQSIFKERFQEAYEAGLDLLEDEVRRRGFEGYEVKEITEAEVMDREGNITTLTTTRIKNNYDTTMALAYLKKNRPTWRDHTVQDINAKVGPSELSDSELDAEIEKRMKRMATPVEDLPLLEGPKDE